MVFKSSKTTANVFGIIFKLVIICIISFMILFPLYWIFISSITPSGELFKTPIDYFPNNPTLDNYRYLVDNVSLIEKIGNTLFIIGSTLLISTFLCVFAAYAFARDKSSGIKVAYAFIVATMLIPEVVTIRHLYEFFRKVNLYDTYLGLIILYVSSVIPFTIIIIRNFIENIPVSIEEAAEIDGARFREKVFFIVFPLLKPAIATILIINFITSLNNFFTPLYFSNGIQVMATAITQLPLRDNMYSVPWDLVSAMGWIIILPIIIFVVLFEDKIMSGIMAGGVKA